MLAGVFTTDLTLAELKTLRARQQFPERDQSYNGRFQVPTLEEYIKLAKVRKKAGGAVRFCTAPVYGTGTLLVCGAKAGCCWARGLACVRHGARRCRELAKPGREVRACCATRPETAYT